MRFRESYKAITDAVTENDPAAFFGRDDYAYPTLGFTTKPRNHDGPDIEFNAEEREAEEGENGAEAGWFVAPERDTDSDEGVNDSWALGEGDHLVPGELDNAKPVHAVIDAPMAASIMAAENEHTADYRYAAAGILEAADAWLDANLDTLGDEGEFGPAADEDAATALAEAAINPALQAHLGLTGVGGFSWANLGGYYGIACSQTEERDTNDWHSFGHVRAELDDRVNHTITAGDTEIGAHASADVIDFAEVVMPGGEESGGEEEEEEEDAPGGGD